MKPAPVAPPVAALPRETSLPKVARNQIRVLVLDEEALLSGNLVGVPSAKIEWVGVNAGLKTGVDASGIAKGPYPHAVASRFVVRAPGYLPALSYATAGSVSPASGVASAVAQAVAETKGLQSPERLPTVRVLRALLA